jgi:hypothetical protein
MGGMGKEGIWGNFKTQEPIQQSEIFFWYQAKNSLIFGVGVIIGILRK